jgi:hypothetical protein
MQPNDVCPHHYPTPILSTEAIVWESGATMGAPIPPHRQSFFFKTPQLYKYGQATVRAVGSLVRRCNRLYSFVDFLIGHLSIVMSDFGQPLGNLSSQTAVVRVLVELLRGAFPMGEDSLTPGDFFFKIERVSWLVANRLNCLYLEFYSTD